MAIGTAAAIGLGVAGVGSALGARSSKKAAGKAADTSLAVAQQNNALAQQIYNQNRQTLNPFVQRGNNAGQAINSLLGIGGASAPQQQTASQFNPFAGFTGGDFGEFGYTFPGVAAAYNSGQQPAAQVTSPQQDYNQAFENYQNSTGFRFRQDEGNNSLNTGFAARGALRSGAAQKDFARFNQNIASNEFGNYINQLTNQQNVGLGAASAQAGVGQSFSNTFSANNNAAGTATANAQLVRGQNNPFAAGLGALGGFASSFI